ncbi:MAG: hypothetical protein HYY98_10185 [Burkholderiales bacterium]|nr:hypothetical protein [Burkholderiales bacterium]MBI3153127.1 hypothetical protein [Chloroflexota bacterium]
MMMKNRFEVLLRDRDEFKKLLVQVCWGDIVLCELNKEQGDEKAEMKLYCNDALYNHRDIRFPLTDFMEAMKVAEEELKRL